MGRQLKEASVKLDINGLESDDLALLARMMELAGQAEQSVSADLSQGISTLSLDEPQMDTDISELDPSAGVSMLSSPEMLSPTLDTDDGVQYDESESLGDVVGHDDISTEMDSIFDESFDMGRMSSLAGLTEDVDSDDEDEEQDDDTLDEGRILPDLSINETQEDNGPFGTEEECEMHANMETNGIKGDNFTVQHRPDGYYWQRTVQEDVVNRPEPEQFNNDGVEHSIHDYRHKRTKLGDNTILTDVHESEESDESVEQIYESLSEKFKQFMGEKK